jgi:hypothetical protein
MNGHVKLAGPIPGSLTALTKVPGTNFRLDDSGDLCRLDALSSTVTTTMCGGTACPYPTCSCRFATCPAGGYNVPATTTDVVNPSPPNYPTDAALCCASGFTLRERLVAEGHLDCSRGRPCAVTPKGLTTETVVYKDQIGTNGPDLLTGTIPPELGRMKAVTQFVLSGLSAMDGTIPPTLALLTAAKSL